MITSFALKTMALYFAFYTKIKTKRGISLLAIIVTGGSGYIGSVVSNNLNLQGYDPFVVDINLKSQRGINHDCGFDFFDKAPKVDTLIHLAGSIEVEESKINPMKYYDNNTANTIHLVRNAQKHGVKNIIFASTAAVYESSNNLLTEKSKTSPSNPYGSSKLLCEEVIKNSGMTFSIFRFFNAGGSSIDHKFGEEHEPETHLIPNIIKSTIEDRSVKIFGTDYQTKDGSCIRDYIHVEDISMALIKAIESPTNQIMNLGSGMGYSVKEVIHTAEKVTDKKVKIEFCNRRAGDPPSLLADITMASKWGWVPRYNLESIMFDAFSFMKKG